MRKVKAWLLDDNIFLSGHMKNNQFIPNDKGCGFSYQIICAEDVGKVLFYSIPDVLQKVLEINYGE